jgi:hypothetical protein
VSIDDEPFLNRGAAGAFAYGIMRQVRDDGMRASWTVLAPLGIVARPKTRSREQWPEEYRAARQADGGLAERIAVGATGLYTRAMDVCGMSDVRWRYETKVAAWHRPGLEAHATAYYGHPNCLGRLDVVIGDRARTLDRGDFTWADLFFGSLVHDAIPLRSGGMSWWTVVRAGEFAMAVQPVLGEAGWTEIERLAAMSRGEEKA